MRWVIFACLHKEGEISFSLCSPFSGLSLRQSTSWLNAYSLIKLFSLTSLLEWRGFLVWRETVCNFISPKILLMKTVWQLLIKTSERSMATPVSSETLHYNKFPFWLSTLLEY